MSTLDILSTEEVELLLNKAESDTSAPFSGCRDFDPYDFSKHMSHTIHGLTKLELITEVFCKEASESLSHLLCQKVSIEGSNPEMCTFDEYIKSIKKPVLINYIGVKTLSSIFLLTFGTEFISRVIETLFGGNVNNPVDETRELGKTEIRIGKLIAESMNKSLAESWSLIKSFDFAFLKSVTSTNLVNIAEPQENVIVTKYNLVIDNIQSEFSLCLPVESLNSVRHLLSRSAQDQVSDPESEINSIHLQENIEETTVKLQTVLTETNLSVAELLKLDVGDVISIDLPQNSLVQVGKECIFRAKPGIHEGNRAIRIEEILLSV